MISGTLSIGADSDPFSDLKMSPDKQIIVGVDSSEEGDPALTVLVRVPEASAGLASASALGVMLGMRRARRR